MQALKELDIWVKKQGKIYFQPEEGETAPKGTSSFEGPRGGRYYIPRLEEVARGEKTRIPNVYWHGTPSGLLVSGSAGIHIGSYEAAKAALQARIGVPAKGEWDGTREYGKTLLAGKRRMSEMRKRGEYVLSGFNVDAPEEDYYPTGEIAPKYSSGEKMSLEEKPTIFPVKIIGGMSNTPRSYMSDSKANSQMRGQLTRGTAKRGYYYRNIGEDFGSISATVPDSRHLRILKNADGLRKFNAWLEKQRPGLVQRRVLVHPSEGEPFYRRQWVRPEDRDDVRREYLKAYPNRDVSAVFGQFNDMSKFGRMWVGNVPKYVANLQKLVATELGESNFLALVEDRYAAESWSWVDPQEVVGAFKRMILFEKQRTSNFVKQKYGEKVQLIRAIYGHQAKKIKKQIDQGLTSITVKVNPISSWTASKDFATFFGAQMEYTVKLFNSYTKEEDTLPDFSRIKPSKIVLIKQEVPVGSVWLTSGSTPGIKEKFDRLSENPQYKNADEFLVTFGNKNLKISAANIELIEVKNPWITK